MPRLSRRMCVWALALLPAAVIAVNAVAAGNPDVLRATLSNGLRVVIVRNTLAPVVTTQVNYLVGSNEAPAGFPGTAHALEHMMFRGSPGLSADQLMDISAAMGGNANADTQQTLTQYYFTVPAEDLEVPLHIEAIRMRGLDVSQADWEKERGAIEQEVANDLSNPQYVFYTQLLAALFKGTPYAHDALGTRPSFDKTSAAMLKAFYASWYAPNNAILVIVGDVRPRATLALVGKLFSGIPARKLPPRPGVELQPVPAETLNLSTDLPYGLSLTTFRLPGYLSPDYAAGVVLADVLNSQRGSLYALVPEGKALYAGFQRNTLPAAGLGYALGVFPKGGDAAALTREIQEVLARVVKAGVPADLVAAAKRSEIAAFEFEKNSVPGLANAWSSALALQGRQSPDDLIAALDKVTVADVDRVARQYLDREHAIVAILTPQQSGKPVAGKGFGGAESFAAAPGKPVQLPHWAAQALSRLHLPQSTVRPVVSMLANGIRLIVQPEEVSGTVAVYGRIRNQPELQQPAGKEGVADVLDQLFGYGTTSLDRIAFQKALDDIAASETAGTQFSVEAPAAHFERAVQLLADNELHPALPEPAFKVVQMQTARFTAGNLESPDYLFRRAIIKALVPANDPTLREALPQSVMGLQLEDVQTYYHRAYRPDLTTIVVIGQVTPAAARAAIVKYFGGWRAAGPPPATDLNAIPLNTPSRSVVPDRSRVQDQVVLAENLGVNLFSADRYALELGNEVLSGGLFANRLYQDLRVKTGLVYYVHSSLDLIRNRGTFQVEYGCDPDKAARARMLVVRNLKAMQNAPVTATELKRAKATLLRQIPLDESSTGRIAEHLLYDSTHGLPLDEPLVAARHYLRLTAPQVQAAYQHWIRPDDLVETVKGPDPE
ncbi:MAG: insulinase family protein [Gammaproteobacteria bacterium]|nr:insulinase family protein [Gammaproteobacteria bacterium]